MVDYARRIEQPLLDFPSVSLPAFSTNGRRIAFAKIDVRGRELYVMDFPNGKPMRIPTTPIRGFLVSSWSLDDRVLIGSSEDGRVVSMSLDSPGNPVTLVTNGGQPQLSPDGRWLAYTSTVSGQPEVYVQSFPGGGDRRRVSAQGGFQPRWRGDGAELFYLTAEATLMALRLQAGARFEAGPAQRLFRDQGLRTGSTPFDLAYLPTRDGQRFLVHVPTEGPVPMTAVRNWLTPAAGDSAAGPR